MNFYHPLPSLERMSFVKTAIVVYNAFEISEFEHEYGLPLCWTSREKLEVALKECISKICLPELLREKVSSLMRIIIFQVEMWKMDHFKFEDMKMDVRKFLVWKSEGSIDRYRTAIEFIQNDILSFDKSFELASIYCLSEQAELLWAKMSESQRTELSKRNQSSDSLVSYYIAKCQGRFEIMQVHSCSTVAALRYVLAQLSSDQVTLALLTAIRFNTHNFHVLRFCLSQLKYQEQSKVFKKYPSIVLSCFINWPWQSLFIDVANQLWDYLSKFNYLYNIKLIMCERIAAGWKDYDYEKLLTQFWHQSPPSFKEYVKRSKIIDMELLTEILNRNRIHLT